MQTRGSLGLKERRVHDRNFVPDRTVFRYLVCNHVLFLDQSKVTSCHQIPDLLNRVKKVNVINHWRIDRRGYKNRTIRTKKMSYAPQHFSRLLDVFYDFGDSDKVKLLFNLKLEKILQDIVDPGRANDLPGQLKGTFTDIQKIYLGV